jgi:hypothetical protein
MSARLRAACAAFVLAALAGCTAILGEGEFAIEGSDAGPSATIDSGSSGGGSSSGGSDGGSGPVEAGVCAPGQTQCLGQQPQTCSGGRWQNSGAPCGGANPFCLAGACKPCMPGTHECEGQTVDECSVVGTWAPSIVCPDICDAGVCSGQCSMGTSQCNGTAVETCGSNGLWSGGTTCQYACVDGACGGSCVPATVQCVSATEMQTCDNTGTWQPTACSDGCSGGSCVFGCVAGQTRCNGQYTPQVCDSTSTWQDQTECAQPTPDCEAGACTCLETSCPSGCTDVSTDSTNCGACGNDCQGQPCSGGMCQPIALATGQDQPWGIALGSSNCYWTDRGNGTVMTVSAAGTGTPSVVASSQNSPTGIATDAMNVYWVDTVGSGSVLACALGGCTSPTPLAANQSSPWGLTVPPSGGAVYFTAGSSAWSASLEDAGVATIGTETGTPYAIATDGANVYWSDSTGGVYKCASSGCTTPAQLSAPAGQPSYGIALDATNVYFTLGAGTGGGGIWTVPKAAGPASQMAAASAPCGIAYDAATSFVYWTDTENSTVMKMITGDGGSPVTVASGQNNPTDLVLDSTYVYWTNAIATSGSIMRMLK